jgi:hypothetical protein
MPEPTVIVRMKEDAIAADAKPEHLVSPGHMFPLRATPGGVLARAGHTEVPSTSPPWRACSRPPSSAN